MAQGAVFLDRDGTINEEMGYINHPKRFIVFPFVAQSVRIFNDLGLKVIIVTNQSGVARGYFSEMLVNELHQKLIENIMNEGAKIDAIYYCPHHPIEGKNKYKLDCACRKPKPETVKPGTVPNFLTFLRKNRLFQLLRCSPFDDMINP